MTIPTGGLTCFLDEHDDNKSMLVGGYYIPRRKLQDLDQKILAIKSQFDIPGRACVKWNLKDPACCEAREAIGSRVDEFREALFDGLSTLEVRLLMSLVWKGDSSYRAESWKWAFENVLQRLCIILDIKKSKKEALDIYPSLDVVFDWLPSSKKVDEYLGVYADAFYDGYHPCSIYMLVSAT